MWIAQRALLAIAKTFKPKQQVESNYDIEREYLKLKVSIEVFFITEYMVTLGRSNDAWDKQLHTFVNLGTCFVFLIEKKNKLNLI